MIVWCMVPEIWSARDRISCHYGLFFVLKNHMIYMYLCYIWYICILPNTLKIKSFPMIHHVYKFHMILAFVAISVRDHQKISFLTIAHFSILIDLFIPLILSENQMGNSK